MPEVPSSITAFGVEFFPRADPAVFHPSWCQEGTHCLTAYPLHTSPFERVKTDRGGQVVTLLSSFNEELTRLTVDVEGSRSLLPADARRVADMLCRFADLAEGRIEPVVSADASGTEVVVYLNGRSGWVRTAYLEPECADKLAGQCREWAERHTVTAPILALFTSQFAAELDDAAAKAEDTAEEWCTNQDAQRWSDYWAGAVSR